MASPVLFTRENPVLAAYCFYAGILVIKMLAMSLLTARQRMKYKVFSNPEDAAMVKGKIKFDNPDVERVRRAHLNDLENVLPFLFIGWLFVLTNPCPVLAVNLFRVFTATRLLHTLVYAIVVMRQPSRGIAFGIGYIITGYMAVHTILHFW